MSNTYDEMIDRLWRSGMDTADIARIIGRPESDVYNARARRQRLTRAA